MTQTATVTDQMTVLQTATVTDLMTDFMTVTQVSTVVQPTTYTSVYVSAQVIDDVSPTNLFSVDTANDLRRP